MSEEIDSNSGSDKKESIFKNWKSTGAFILFIGAYLYSMYVGKDADTVEVAGYVALYSSVFMMLRSQMTSSILEKIVDKIKV